jgi:hypothetical protein
MAFYLTTSPASTHWPSDDFTTVLVPPETLSKKANLQKGFELYNFHLLSA